MWPCQSVFPVRSTSMRNPGINPSQCASRRMATRATGGTTVPHAINQHMVASNRTIGQENAMKRGMQCVIARSIIKKIAEMPAAVTANPEVTPWDRNGAISIQSLQSMRWPVIF